jgi:acyl-CoA reductase-like NAD-dependent aldehyde dehydrogenase
VGKLLARARFADTLRRVKESGVGREGGWEALRFFTEAKNVCIKYE